MFCTATVGSESVTRSKHGSHHAHLHTQRTRTYPWLLMITYIPYVRISYTLVDSRVAPRKCFLLHWCHHHRSAHVGDGSSNRLSKPYLSGREELRVQLFSHNSPSHLPTGSYVAIHRRERVGPHPVQQTPSTDRLDPYHVGMLRPRPMWG